MSLIDELMNYTHSRTLPMHMPGHKRKKLCENLPWEIDITEINGFDDLHQAQGILKNAMDEAAKLFEAQRTFFLVNGSTAGILAGICAAAKCGEKVIVSRSCHRSVYNALELHSLVSEFIVPQQMSFGAYAGISEEQVEKKLEENADAKLVIICSPTYEGAVSDLKGIVKAAHSRGIPVLVDSAHGAHFGFSSGFPESAVSSGADIVVQSLHKTLPGLTQTALLHFKSGIVNERELERQLSIFQTSSPSYPLMASIDFCVQILREQKEKLFSDYEAALACFDKKVKGLEKLRVLCYGNDNVAKHPELFDFDKGKLVIETNAADITGVQLMSRLRENYGIELEMSLVGYALAMTSVCDTKQSLLKLADALLEIDKSCSLCNKVAPLSLPPLPKRRILSQQARERSSEQVPIEEACNRISGDMLWAYPPGVPLIIPGEVVGNELIEFIKSLNATGIKLYGENGSGADVISVLQEN